MGYNFKSIADVEVVKEPDESVNVLVEESGQIKRVPKNSVAPPPQPINWEDIRNKPPVEPVYYILGTADQTEHVASRGTYEALKNAITNGTFVQLLIFQKHYESPMVFYKWPRYMSLRDDGVIEGETEHSYLFEVFPDDTATVVYND